MKTFRTLPLMLLTAGLLTMPHGQACAQSDEDVLKVVRSVIKADRQAVVTQALQLTPAESEKFWPLYHQYRAEMDKVADGLVKLVQDYARYYPNVPEDRAKEMLKDLTDLEKKQVSTRASFLKKFGKLLPADKNLRFAQVESRLDLALRLELAANVPLVPIEGRISGESTSAAVAAEGVVGGTLVQTHQLTATVVEINKASRKVTLLSRDGIKQTVKVGPDAINFDQIRLGDTLKVEVTEELVVQLAGPGESSDEGAAAVVALAPKGAKPGGVMAATTQVLGTVTAIDPQKRTATLRFEDGSTRTFPVRSDVDLGKRKVGEKVAFRVTEVLAISVQKP
jgi:hypothetical protein